MKKLMKKYGHVWILSYGLIYLPWFAALQQNVGKTLPRDAYSPGRSDPVQRVFYRPPICCGFLYVAAAIAYFFFTSKDDYSRLCTFFLQA